MAFLEFPDCMQAEVRLATNVGRPAEVTFWYRKTTGSVDQSDVDDLAELIDDYVAEEFIPLWNTAWNYQETFVRDMTAEISYFSSAVAGAGAGTESGTPVEASSAMVLVRRSGLMGRSSKGRIYFPGGVGADRLNVGNWDPTVIGARALAVELMDTAVTTTLGFLPIIASRKLMTSTGNTLLSTFEVVDWTFASTRIAKVSGRSG